MQFPDGQYMPVMINGQNGNVVMNMPEGNFQAAQGVVEGQQPPQQIAYHQQLQGQVQVQAQAQPPAQSPIAQVHPQHVSPQSESAPQPTQAPMQLPPGYQMAQG